MVGTLSPLRLLLLVSGTSTATLMFTTSLTSIALLCIPHGDTRLFAMIIATFQISVTSFMHANDQRGDLLRGRGSLET